MNAPSTGPVVSDSTDRPASSTDCRIHCAPSATASCTMPQPNRRLPRQPHQRRLVSVGPHVLQIEIVHRRRGHRVERRRQRRGDDRRDDEADRAVRQRGDDEARQDLVVAAERRRAAARAGDRRTASTPISRNSVNCAKTMNAAQDQPALRLRLRPRRQQPLHQELVGAVRRERQRDAAGEAGPERVDPCRIEREIEDRELAGRRAQPHDFCPAAGDAATAARRTRPARRRRR